MHYVLIHVYIPLKIGKSGGKKRTKRDLPVIITRREKNAQNETFKIAKKQVLQRMLLWPEWKEKPGAVQSPSSHSSVGNSKLTWNRFFLKPMVQQKRSLVAIIRFPILVVV
jgi:hypothetical protein